MDVKKKNNLTRLALVAFVVVFAIGDYGLGFEQWTIHWWADISWTLASLLTGVKCLQTARHLSGRYKRAWISFGAACLAWFLGMLVWDYRELVLNEVTPFPALSDGGYLLFVPFMVLGFLWYRADSAPAQITLKQICNLGIIVSAIATTVPVILLDSIRASTESGLYLAVAVAYPVCFLAAFLFGLSSLWFSVFGANRTVFSWLLAGIAVHAFTNTLYAASLLGHTYQAGNYLDVYWIIGFALIYTAAVRQEEMSTSPHPDGIPEVDSPHARELENFVSAAALLTVVSVLFVFREGLRGDIVPYTFTMGVIGIGFVGVREWWGYRTERSLHGELRSSFRALAQNEARLAGILEIAPEGIICVDAGQRIVLFNQGAQNIFGYSEREALGASLDLLIPGRFHAAHRAHVEEFSASAATKRQMNSRQEVYGRRKNGTEFPAEASLSKFEGDGERVFTVVIRDVTERRKAADVLRHRIDLERIVSAISAQFINLESEKVDDAIKGALQKIGEFSQVDRSYVFLWSENRVTVSNRHEWWADGIEPRSEWLANRPTDEFPWLSGHIMQSDIVHIPCVDALPLEPTSGRQALQREGIRSLLCVPMVYAQSVIGLLGFDTFRAEKTWRDEDISLLKVVAEIFTSVLIRKRAEETLEEQAIRDPLTNLYNRRHFNFRIEQEIALAEQKGHCLAVVVCDLDHFKELNDTQGHQAGDRVLKEVAASVNESTRGSDCAFRWGGDEIIVLLSNTSKEGVLIAARRIREGVGRLQATSDSNLDISIGIALYPEHGRSPEDLVRLADRALYIAKKGGDKIHIGEEEYHLRDDTIKVVFQPVVDIRLNENVGFEALSRDAQGKLNVLDLFKKYQAIGLLDDLKALCFTTQVKVAQTVGIQKVFINVDFKLLGRLQPAAVPPGLDIILEISEGEALHDVEDHLAIAKRWREYGYKFAIDDFGAGFISLPFIARLIPEHIKLDRSTIIQAVESNRFRRILKDLLLGLRNCSTDGLIAEGIESAHELEVVREMGIYLVQGYLLGKPEERRPYV